MKSARLVVAVLVLALVAALVAWWPGQNEAPSVEIARPPGVGVVGPSNGTGGSWFCAARDVGVAGSSHSVIMKSVANQPVEVALSLFGGADDEPAPELEPIVLEAGETSLVNIGDLGGSPNYSVMAESPDGPISVEHRFTSPAGADQAACTPYSSPTWHFPVVATTRDAKALLSLFNPFPADASVDIQVALDNGVRIPQKLSGLVIPSGTTRVVDLGAEVQRREQFSASVKTRTGTVVAELGQTFDGSNPDFFTKGVRLVQGSRVGATQWSIAAGFVDSSARERVIVFNPNNESVKAVVQVLPYRDDEALPEPFELEVPSLRYAELNLDAETRVPPGYHAIAVESSDGAPVVVARSMTVTDESDSSIPLRSEISSGTTASPGSASPFDKWLATGLQETAARQSSVFVFNPSDGIAVVSLLADGKDGGERYDVEIGPGDGSVVTADELGVSGTFSVTVTSDTDVVVERLIVFINESDFSMQPAVPVIEDPTDLVAETD